MNVKRLITAYILLLWLVVLGFFAACAKPDVAVADTQAADRAWEAVYGGLSETEWAKAAVLEPTGDEK